MDVLINEKIIAGIANPIVTILVMLALIYFLVNMTTYLTSADSKKQSDAKSGIIYGIIFLFVMVSVWALVNVLNKYFLRGNSGQAPYPSGNDDVNVNELIN